MKTFAGIFTFRATVICSLVLAGGILYCRTLPYPFAFDCWTFIQQNALITDLKYFSLLADPNALALAARELGLPPAVSTDFLLRPLLNLTFCANYLIHGLSPTGFRAVNIALHIFNALLLFLFLERLIARSAKSGAFDGFSARFIPAFAAMLFMVHPLQIETVTYIVQRSNSLATGFCLMALVLYHRFATKPHQPRGWLFRWGSAAALLCGMFAEESVVTAPLLLLLLETVCLGHALKPSLKRLTPHLCLLPVVPFMVLMARGMQNADGIGQAGILNILNYSGYSPYRYGVTQLCVITDYLRLLLFPYGQNVDPHHPLNSSLLQWQSLGALVILVLVIVAPALLFLHRRDFRSSLLLFGTGWFFLGLAASSGIVPLPDLMAESRVYGASIGFFMALAVMLDWLRKSQWGAGGKRRIVAAAVVLVIAYGTVAWARNTVWSSNISLWTDAAAKSPGKERVWHNLGMAYMDAARHQEAMECFTRALSLNPSYQLSHEALVTAYTRAGRFADAQDAAFAGLMTHPENAVLHNNLGVVYAETGQAGLASQAFERALRLRPGYASARMNLEQVLAEGFEEEN